jgi:hypothetical protein
MGRDANDDLREGGEEAVSARYARAKTYKPKANGKASANTTKPESDMKSMDEALDLLRDGYSIEQVVAHFARMERERLIKVSEIPSKKKVLEWAAKEGVAVSLTDKPPSRNRTGRTPPRARKARRRRLLWLSSPWATMWICSTRLAATPARTSQ